LLRAPARASARAPMLDAFPREIAPVSARRTEKKPPELVGFVSEVRPKNPSPPRNNAPSGKTSLPPPIAITARASVVVCLAIVVPIATAVWRSRAVNEDFSVPEGRDVFLSAEVSAPEAAAPLPVVASPVYPLASVEKLATQQRARTQPPNVPAAAPIEITEIKPSPKVPSTPVELSPPPAAPAAPPSAVDNVAIAAGAEETAIRALLERYRAAYERLDAGAAAEAWPTVDPRGLARAFADMSSQTLTFERCQTDITQARAVARCHGRASYVARVGSRTQFSRDGEWIFALSKIGDDWKIDSVRSP
jgi:hypothetical protein